MKPEPLFYLKRDADVEAGPYDLVQMAGLLRKKIISPETITRLEGTEDWKPFSWQPQFLVAREMSPDAVSTRVEMLDEAAEDARHPFPVPARETVLKLGGLVLGTVLAGVGAYLASRIDGVMGGFLMFAGGGAVLAGQCLIWVRLLDEDYRTLALVLCVPFGDVYYFISNIWEYFTWFCVKYVGLAVVLGAVAGMAAH